MADTMKIKPFETEEFFALYEFSTPHMLSASDCESLTIAELLGMAHKTLDDLGACLLHYTESQGGHDVREAIAASHPCVLPEEVIMLNAPQEGIYLAMRALLEPDDHVMVITPCYDSLTQVAEHIGCHVHRHELDPTTNGWTVDLCRFEAELKLHEPSVVVVNFPHNPTGHVLDARTWQQLQELVSRYGATLFSDEMYRGLELFGREMLPSAASHENLRSTSVTLAGLSKSHGLPGLRSGWLIVPDEHRRADVLAWKHYTSICAPAPVEWLTQVALSVEQELFARHRASIERHVELVESFLTRHDDFGWRRPLAGSTALLDTPWEDVEPRAHQLARDAGVMVLPGKCLGAPAHTIRLGLGRAGFADALARFERAL